MAFDTLNVSLPISRLQFSLSQPDKLMMSLRKKKIDNRTHKKAKAHHWSVKKLNSVLHQTHRRNEFHFRGKMHCLGTGGSGTVSWLQSSKTKKSRPPIRNMGGIQPSIKLYHILFVVT